MDQEPEVLAMGKVFEALKDLSDDGRERVLDWAFSKFNFTKPSNNSKINEIKSNKDGYNHNLLNSNYFNQFEDIHSLFTTAQVKTEQEKVLLTASFLQIKNPLNELTSREINSELNDAGVRISNITTTIVGLISKKPPLILQTKKDGTSPQAQKKYKVTPEGIKVALGFFNSTDN